MAPAGSFKPTLQLRHQLSCRGIAVRAAAYDARRHHVLTYDSHALRPHALRLFSLRREIRTVPLFDADNQPPPRRPPPPPPATSTSAKKRADVPPADDPVASTVLRCVFLFYAHELDVFLCVFSAFREGPGGDAAPTGYRVVFLEPASLRKLVVYDGPRAHVLKCAWFDERTGRLVLASRVAPSWPSQTPSSQNRSRTSTARVATPAVADDRSNVVEFLDISKRPFRRPMSAISVASSGGDVSADRVMLCVEKMTRATLWHSDPIEFVAGPPRLHALFGAGVCVYDDDGGDREGQPVGAGECSIVLEWRASADGNLALARRVVHERDPITSLATSPSGQWMFTGHTSGVLKVWNMVCKANPEDGNPQTFAPAADSTSSHTSAVAAIEVKPASSTMGTSADLETAMLYTTERASGHTRHWRFCGSVQAATTATPQLDCLGVLDVDPASEIRKDSKRKNKRGTLGDWTRTIPLCISVKMGSYSENLLVVIRGDMIHVVKIQALLQVVHDVPHGEEIFALRSLQHRDGSVAVVCFSGTASFSQLHISRMDPRSTKITAPKQSCLPAPAHLQSSVVARLTRLQVCTVNSEDAWIVCGWSSGVVEVYSEQRDSTHRVALLQDPRVDVDITALAIVNDRAGIAKKQTQPVAANEPKYSWGGLLQHPPPLGAAIGVPRDVETSSRYIVLAGTASGTIFGWRITQKVLNDYSTVHFILEASVAVCHPPAHSAHVVDLVALSPESHNLLSMGADGILKLWDVPSMRLTHHINAAASSGAGGTRLGMLCSCVQVLTRDKAIVVGYEDGAIAVWQKQTSSVVDETNDLVELQVTGRHERRVSSIVVVDELKFLTASLDMTIVLWEMISNTDQVEELRFFDFEGPVVDCCVVGSIVLVALRNEVCWLTLEEGEDPNETPPPLPASEVVSQAEINAMENAETIHEETKAPTDAPSQPEESSPRSPTQAMSPSPHEESVISIPSVIVPGSMTTMESFPPYSRSGISGSLEGWMTDQANESPVDDEVISLYVRQYVASCGSLGTIAAESLSHFLAMHHVPLSKRLRPDFVIRKYLHGRKIDPKTRLTASEATALLLEIQRAAEPERTNDHVAIKSKASNGKMRRESLKRLAEPRKKANRVLSEKPVDNRVAVVTYNILGEKSVKWVSSGTSNQEISDPYATITGEGGSTAGVVPVETRPTQLQRRRKQPPIKTVVTTPVIGLPDRELLHRMHLSPSFRPMWSSGFCWCANSHLVVQWDKGATHDTEKKPRSVKCDSCGNWCHRVKVQSKHYTPHFTARTILGIIADVYDIMMEPAHHLLYKNDEANTRPGSELSIHAALWKLFQHKFGVQHIVENKLKLLFVSMCHLVREMDAVAVFGELLALFQRPNLDEQVPHKMVALCVVTHSWLYAREMIVNGDPILGSSDSSMESSKATHWQFASLTNALFCAQEVLVYPLVSPGYLRNILAYMEDYAQRSPTKPIHEEVGLRDEHDNGVRWIEVHRLLRLLVGEWKQQATDLRTTERLLFIEPLATAHEAAEQDQPLVAVLEKLRLILSCFVFYDHERIGLAEVTDFEDILRRLKYLWPNEHLSEQEAAGAKRYQDSLTFENTILASRKRFADAQGDGRICYLDFWAMLYIVGVRTKSLLKFREIPSFCKDYKLEVSPGLQDMLRVYMERSSALLLPRGFQTSKSSVDESTHHQHQRRVGGLYDGIYIVDQPTVSRTLSMQELLSDESQNAKSGLFVDGSVPSMRQSASTTALDAYNSGNRDDMSLRRAREPVVVGVRPLGPTPKPTAFLRLSSLDHAGIEEGASGRLSPVNTEFTELQPTIASLQSPSTDQLDSLTNVYIQFPDVTPRKTRIDLSGTSSGGRRSTVGSISVDQDEEAKAWRQQFMQEHENDEYERQVVHEEYKRRMTLQKEHASIASAAAAPVATAPRHHYGHSSPPKDRPSPTKPDVAESKVKSSAPVETSHRVGSAKALAASSARAEEPVVVIPTIEKHAVRAPTHGFSTIEALARHAVLERQPLHSADSDVSIVTVDLKDTVPVAKWAASPREVNLADVAPNDVSIVTPSTTLKPPLEESVTRPPSPLPTVVSVIPSVTQSVIDHEEDDDDDGEGAEEEAVDNDDEGESGGEPSEGDDNSDDEQERAEDGVVEDTPVVEKESQPLPAEEPTVVAVIETSPSQWVDEERPSISHHDEGKMAEPNHREMSQATEVTEPKSEGLNRASEVIDTVSTGEEATSSGMTKALDSETVAPVIAVQTNSSPMILPEHSPPPPVNVPLPSPAKPSTATVALSPTKPGPKPSSSELRHRFKFSQQPKFQLSAAIVSNPFRSKAWKPHDDSDSGDDGNPSDDEDAYDDGIAVEDMRLRVSRGSLAELRKMFGRKSSTTRTAGLAALAFTPGDNNRRRLGTTLAVGMDDASEEGPRRRGANNAVRLDEDAERALYGGRALSYLGEGIVFSAEAEALMQHKWSDFFGTAEASMFSPLKDVLKHREDVQRQQEELQSRLMKKRMEQQHQDNMRLQRNATPITLGKPSQEKIAADKQDVASFRARRMTREACLQVQQQLTLGETVASTLSEVNATQYFHFEYSPDASTGWSIITFKLHVLQGEADLFLSTQTTAPCSSDFMWRSAENCVITAATPSTSDLEGQKIVLFPHDIAHIVGRSGTTKLMFYMAVVALAPNSTFTLGVMTSGQKAEPSRAIQTVDTLIAHFNQLAKTYEGQASRRMIMTAESNSSGSRSSSSGSSSSSVDRLRAFLASAASMESVQEEELGDGVPAQTMSRHSSSRELRRLSQVEVTKSTGDATDDGTIPMVDDTDEDEDGENQHTDASSFQQLLESIGDKRALGLRKTRSFLLGGPTSAQREFLQDEEASYQETKARLSPARAQLPPGTADTEVSFGESLDDGESAAIAVVTERRLSAASSLALQQRLGAKVKRRLSPLKAARKQEHKADSEPVGLRVARFEPKLAAYSLSSLPPPKHPHKQLSAVAPTVLAKNKR